MEQALRHDIIQVLDAGQDLTLATLREDGWPQATTVSFVNDGLAIYFGCSSSSQKARNLARDPRVSLTVTLPYGDWGQIRGVSVGGLAQRIVAPAQIMAIGALFLDKFPQIAQAFQGADEGELALFCVTPQVISLLDYRKGFGHTVQAQAGELELEPA